MAGRAAVSLFDLVDSIDVDGRAGPDGTTAVDGSSTPGPAGASTPGAAAAGPSSQPKPRARTPKAKSAKTSRRVVQAGGLTPPAAAATAAAPATQADGAANATPQAVRDAEQGPSAKRVRFANQPAGAPHSATPLPVPQAAVPPPRQPPPPSSTLASFLGPVSASFGAHARPRATHPTPTPRRAVPSPGGPAGAGGGAGEGDTQSNIQKPPTIRELMKTASATAHGMAVAKAGALAAKEKRKAKRAQAAATTSTAAAAAAAATAQQQPVPAAPPQQSSIAPQLAIVDGKIVVNTDSLTVAAQQTTLVANAATRRIVEGVHGRQLNASTYAPKRPNERWGMPETTRFYTALSQFGTDFSMIATLFPGRDRRAIKNKFTREEKQNRDRVEAALKWQLGGGGSAPYDETGASVTTAHLSAFLEKLEAQENTELTEARAAAQAALPPTDPEAMQPIAAVAALPS